MYLRNIKRIAINMGLKWQQNEIGIGYLFMKVGDVELRVTCQAQKIRDGKISFQVFDHIVTIRDLECPLSFANVVMEDFEQYSERNLDLILTFETLAKKTGSPINPADYLLPTESKCYKKRVFVLASCVAEFLSHLDEFKKKLSNLANQEADFLDHKPFEYVVPLSLI